MTETKYPENSLEWKKNILLDKGLSHGNRVRFKMENQSLWIGPNTGVLYNIPKDVCIMAEENGDLIRIEINEYLGAYINTIEKY